MINTFLSTGWAKKRPVGRSGFFFLFCFSFFIDSNVLIKLREKNFFKNHEKKSSSWPFLVNSGGGQGTTFYLRVALIRPSSLGDRRGDSLGRQI